jgi:hypothetical protein
MVRNRKYHYIYKTTNIINNKFYIGMHSTDNLNDGYLGSGKRLWFSINYHGKKNHKIEILEFCEDREKLKIREKEIVNNELINEKLCLNLQVGGGGGIISEEHHKKMKVASSKYQKEKWKDPEYSEKIKKILSENMKKGHKHRSNYNMFQGKKHSDETKNKMKQKRKGTGVAELNSQYGTCWVSKDNRCVKIKKNEIERWINEGWVKGKFLIPLDLLSQIDDFYKKTKSYNKTSKEFGLPKSTIRDNLLKLHQ